MLIVVVYFNGEYSLDIVWKVEMEFLKLILNGVLFIKLGWIVLVEILFY